MNELKSYLSAMSLVDRQDFADKCGTTWAHLRNVAYGYRVANEKLCVSVERLSNGAVTRRDMRPDDWADIWPELASLKTNNSHTHHLS